MEIGLKMGIQVSDWSEATIRAKNLSEIMLILGEVASAAAIARNSMMYADYNKENPLSFLTSRCAAADALYQFGLRAEAEVLFREAEFTQKEKLPIYSILYSVQGFQYCDFLLDRPLRAVWQLALNSAAIPAVTPLIESCRTAFRRATRTFQWAKENNGDILSGALDQLTQGRAKFYEAKLNGTSSDSRCSLLQSAVEDIHLAGTQHYLPQALLTRGWLRMTSGVITGPESAESDLNEASEISERGPMRLNMADIYLYRARLFFREKSYPWKSPQDDLAAAERLINECGYHRRDEELGDAKRAILGT